MFSKKFTLKVVAAFTLVVAIASCSKEETTAVTPKSQNATSQRTIHQCMQRKLKKLIAAKWNIAKWI